MFPYGWPGRGLLFATASRRIYFNPRWHGRIDGDPPPKSIAVQLGATIAGVFLLVGAWTPIAGVIVALSEIGIALAGTDHLQATILLATLGLALAFLGPGALSIDARLFGRKRLYK